MDTKKCGKCGEVKPVGEFNKNKNNKDGLGYYCRSCMEIENRDWRHSIDGKIKKIYNNQKTRSKRKGWILPTYTVKELSEFMYNHNYTKLFNDWVFSDFDRNLAPSIDRLDDTKGYSMNNIRLVTWKVNNDKARADIRSGKLVNGAKPQKPIQQIDKLTGEIIAEYVSTHQASRETGINRGNICSSARDKNKFKTSGGYKWRYI